MAQQLQNITVAAPGFAGLNTQDSPIGIDPSFASVADNCVIDQLGRIGARKGWVEVSTNGAAVLGTSRGIETVYEFIDNSGDKVMSCQQVTIKSIHRHYHVNRRYAYWVHAYS